MKSIKYNIFLFTTRFLVLLLSLSFIPQAWSQAGFVVGPGNNTTPPPAAKSPAPTTNTPTNTPTNTTATAPAPTAAPIAASGLTNAAGSSNSGSALAAIGQIVTGGVGVYMASMCGPHNAMACVLAVQCALQLAQTAAAKSGTDGVYGAYSPGTGGVGGTFGTGDPGGGGSSTEPGDGTGKGIGNGTAITTGADLIKIKSGLANAGVAIDPVTGAITLPNGQTVPANSSAGSMKASGFDSSSIDQTLADEKKLEAKLLANANAKTGTGSFGYQGGGGGRATANVANPNASMDMNSFLNSRMGADGRNAKSGKASVAGLSKKLGSENIGVKGDNIFEMVNRRYQSQHKQNAFLREN